MDNCPYDANTDQADADSDLLGDVCDICPLEVENDADGDGHCAAEDNCPYDSNTDQADSDVDLLGDVCDACPNDADNDTDGDDICGDVDNCPYDANTDQADADSDLLGNVCDDDDDGDGDPDTEDCAPFDPTISHLASETCGDATDNNCDGETDEGCCNPLLDSDGDGYDDCADQCPLDAARILVGDCGCPSAPAAPGTPCGDGVCEANDQCDGAGTCGDPDDCAPAASCTFARYPGQASSGYYFCTDSPDWNQARTSCQSRPGMDLVRIDDQAENDFVTDHLADDAWIGASDAGTEDLWIWVADGDQFWQGEDNGYSVGGLYENWENNEPDDTFGQDCGIILTDGVWNDADCGDSYHYVCEVVADQCPDDPKLLPGECGCEELDVDTDGDGTLDCFDECPLHGDRVLAGDCGCPSDPEPQGTACDDGLCAANTECDGAGNCGTPDECVTAAAISANTEHTCALTENGRVACWGVGGGGRLGYSGTEDRRGPVTVGNLYDAVQISSGTTHSCAVRENGQVACWGTGTSGQLGHGSWSGSELPVTVSGITDAVAVACGNLFSCALLQSSEVRCWGEGSNGRLGTGGTGDRNTPGAVLAGETGAGNLTGAFAITAGGTYACALLDKGRVACWGAGGSGQLGNDATPTTQSTPVYVHGVDNAGTCTGADPSGCLKSMILIDGGASHTCASGDFGSVYCWGSGGNGRLGYGGSSQRNYPVSVLGVGGVGVLDDAVWISAGTAHSCAVRESGQAVCWGEDSDERLGDDGAGGTDPSHPVAVAGATDYQQVTAGELHTCGLRLDGTARCWGSNANGRLGDGTATLRSTPFDTAGMADAVEVDSGLDHSCAVVSTGEVYCWGSNGNYELGLGSGDSVDRWAPVRIPGIDNAVDVATGQNSSCALLQTGGVKCWGSDSSGQNGDGVTGSPSNRDAPVDVVGLSDAVEITGGLEHYCALTDPAPIGEGETQVWCWGAGGSGRLGHNSAASDPTPVQVHGVGNMGWLTDAVAIGAGWYHTCATRTNGQVACWGEGGDGQLGNNGTDDFSYPVTVLGVGADGVLAGMAGGRRVIDGGQRHTCALAQNGDAFCWGSNADGRLGEGSASAGSPVPVVVYGSPPLAVIWVKTDLTGGASKDIYMSYGDPALPPASDPDATFLLYDGFDGSSLDTASKWTNVNSGTGSATVSGGNLTIASTGAWGGTADTSRIIVSQADMGSNFIAETRIASWGSNLPNMAFGLRSSAATNSRMFGVGFVQVIFVQAYYSAYRQTDGANATTGASATGFPGGGYVARFIKMGNTVESYYNEALIDSQTFTNWDLERVALTDSGGTDPNQFDWVRVRAYLANEPLVTPNLDDALNGSCGTCYDKSIGVDNGAGGSVSGYQLRVVLDARHLNFWHHVTASGDDIRFFDSDGTTPLNYWIETLAAPDTLFDFNKISAFSQGHTCAVTPAGEVACWGLNGSYQVGDGTTEPRSSPVIVDHDAAAAVFGNTDLQSPVVTVSTGDEQSLAVHSNGALSAWGNGGQGRKGTGTNATGGTPEAACIPVR